MIAIVKRLINSSFRCIQYLKYGLGLLFLISYLGYSSPVQSPTADKSIFSITGSIPPNKRVDAINKVYKDNLRKVPLAVAMAKLDELAEIADSLDDKSLACAVFEMRADYYSVNNKFNSTSTAYYQKAINFAVANKLPFETGLYLHRMGRYYFVYKHYAEACECFLKSQEVFSRIGYDKIPGISYYLSNVADLYYSVGDFDNAKANLEQALKYVPPGTRDKINIINTIGLIYRHYSQYTLAIDCFSKALRISVAQKDTAWIGISQGNIGSVYFLQNQYQKALPYIETDYITSIKHNEPDNGLIALLRLIKINIDGKKFDLAGQQLNTALTLLNSIQIDILGQWAIYYDLKSQLDEHYGKVVESISYRKKFELATDSIARRNNIEAVERVKLRWEIDKRITQLNKLKADEKVDSVEIIAGKIVVALLIIILLLVYNRQRLKNKKDKEILLAERRILDEELKNADTALSLFTENLRQKNALIEDFKQEIEKYNIKSADTAQAAHLERLLKSHIMTDENWKDFKDLFSKVYPGFFINLCKDYPNLSQSDMRIFALFKLGLNNTEMANMLGITVEGIKKAKQRLRKKINIDTVKDIGNAINF